MYIDGMTNDKELSIWTSNRGHAVFMGEVRLTKWFSWDADAQRHFDALAVALSPEAQAWAADLKEAK